MTIPNSPQGRPLAIFSDFDGTIAHPDTINFLAETFGGKEFRREIGRKIVSGEISLRDGIQQEIGVIKGTLDEVLALLRNHVEVDQQFPPFATWCSEHQIPLTVLSAGIKDLVEALLAPHALKKVRIVANPLCIKDGTWSLLFIDDTPWGHDKARDVLQAKAEGYCTVFLGDGLSDRGAAESADVVFARAGLARYCTEQGIPYHEFADFSEVQRKLALLLEQHS